jgi:hypothetical protein
MKQIFARCGLSAAALVAVVALAIVAGPAGPLAAATLSSSGAAGVIGLGFWETLGCIGCIAGFVIGAGTTAAGLAVFLAAHPEVGLLCVSTCIIAAS